MAPPAPPPPSPGRRSQGRLEGRSAALTVLFAVNAINFFDRQILSAVAEPVRREWSLTDTELGWLLTSFTLLYALAGIPFGRAADVLQRSRLLGVGVFFWSLLTFVSGLCGNFRSLFLARLGVGIGEAVCAPAATSMIGDMFPAGRRARALSIFMLGLPAGLALSYIVSGTVGHHYGWRAAFFVAGVPGLLLAFLAFRMREPERGAAEADPIGSARRPGSPYLLVLAIPTMWWIIVSGALHNFCMYAISSFLPAFLMRYHGVTMQNAGFISGILIGALGAAGLLLGGWAGDAVARRRRHARMAVPGAAVLLSVPLGWLALREPPGSVAGFVLLQGAAWMLMYVYYAVVYSTIHDVVEPALRGTAMAIYFFAMYTLGASLGPLATGWASDLFARNAALAAGAGLAGAAALPEQFRAAGLHGAMRLIPWIAAVLALVLFAAVAAVPADMRRLEQWMRRRAAEPRRPGA